MIQGLGEATARKIVENGGHVLLLDVSDKKGIKVAEELNSIQKSSALFHKCNILHEHEIKEGITRAKEEFQCSLAGLVNCAAIMSYCTLLSQRKGPHSLSLFQYVQNSF